MSRKIAFLFPGQGSQYVGMGKDFYDHYEETREIFHQGDQVLGEKISDLCFQGPEDELKKTENTQPAILTTSIAILKVLEQYNIQPDMVAGHSLGEYSALVAAGALSFADAVKTVRRRGQLMVQAVPYGEGTMAAVLKLEREKVEKICQETPGVVEPANFNNPTEIVISGEVDAVHQAMEKLAEAGAKKVVELQVSGPFHSSLLQPASDGLADYLKEIEINDPQIPVIANYTGAPETKADQVLENLSKQVSSAVYWQDSMEYMLSAGVDTFIEIGPGSTLKKMLKRIDRKAKGYHVSDLESLETLISELDLEKR